jgi:hypothetical protein
MRLEEGRAMASKKGGGYQRGRDAKTGQFIPVEEAKRRPSTTVVETFKPKKGK